MTFSEVLSARSDVAPPRLLAVGDIEPSLYNYAFAGLFLFLGSAGMARIGRFWRGQYANQLADAFAPLGKIPSRAACALVPFVFPGAFIVGLLYITLILKAQLHGGLDSAFELFANILTVVFTAVLVVLFCVILFNRPHLVVPPHQRDSHGLIGDGARAALARLRR